MVDYTDDAVLRALAWERVRNEFEQKLTARAELHESEMKRAGKHHSESIRRNIAGEKRLLKQKRRTLIENEWKLERGLEDVEDT